MVINIHIKYLVTFCWLKDNYTCQHLIEFKYDSGKIIHTLYLLTVWDSELCGL